MATKQICQWCGQTCETRHPARMSVGGSQFYVCETCFSQRSTIDESPYIVGGVDVLGSATLKDEGWHASLRPYRD